MEAEAKKVYEVNLVISEEKLNHVVVCIEELYKDAVASGTLNPNYPLWELKDQLVLAKNNAEN